MDTTRNDLTAVSATGPRRNSRRSVPLSGGEPRLFAEPLAGDLPRFDNHFADFIWAERSPEMLWNRPFEPRPRLDPEPIGPLLRRFAVEVFVVGLRRFACRVNDAVAVVRRRVERIEFQRAGAGVDDVMIRPGRDDDRVARTDRSSHAVERRLPGPLFDAKELVACGLRPRSLRRASAP